MAAPEVGQTLNFAVAQRAVVAARPAAAERMEVAGPAVVEHMAAAAWRDVASPAAEESHWSQEQHSRFLWLVLASAASQDKQSVP